MAYAATAGGSLPSTTAAPGVLALQRAMVWLAGASVAIVFIEPSPYELATLAASVIFFATGLRMRLVFMPLLLLLFLINLGYSISAVAVFDRPNVPNWIATSWYMAVTVIFFAMVISEDTAARLDMLRRGLVVGALIAAIAGIAGYFNLIPGGRDLLTLYDRARGTFKDPNVFGAFLVLPALFALQSVVSDKFGKSFRNAIAFGIISFAILLAFSRAAWGMLIITSGSMLVLMVLTSRSQSQRSRIIVDGARYDGAGGGAGRGTAVVRFDRAACSSSAPVSTRAMTRAVSAASAGISSAPRWRSGCRSASGRCSSTASFRKTPTTPTSTPSCRAAGSSGVCYPALVFVTVLTGSRYVFTRVPWQPTYLAIFSAFLGTVGESFIIDTDHWRHFWLMLGAMWGCSLLQNAGRKRPPIQRSSGHPGFPEVLFFNAERQPGMIDQTLDQFVLHRRPRRPDACGNVRRVAQQADRAFRDHLRGRAITGIAVALD